LRDKGICARIDPRRLHASLTMLLGLEYVGPKELSMLLGISRQSAGKLLARMESEGLAARWSRTRYRLLATSRIATHSIYESGQPDKRHNTIKNGSEPLASYNAEYGRDTRYNSGSHAQHGQKLS